MDNFFGAAFALALIIHIFSIMIAVPIWFISERDKERACAETHQVFACEKREEWVPAKPDSEDRKEGA